MQKAILELTAEVAYLRGRPTTSRSPLTYQTPTVERDTVGPTGLPRRTDYAAGSRVIGSQLPPAERVHGVQSTPGTGGDDRSIASEDARLALGALGSGVVGAVPTADMGPTTEDKKRKAEEDSRARARGEIGNLTEYFRLSLRMGVLRGLGIWEHVYPIFKTTLNLRATT